MAKRAQKLIDAEERALGKAMLEAEVKLPPTELDGRTSGLGFLVLLRSSATALLGNTRYRHFWPQFEVLAAEPSPVAVVCLSGVWWEGAAAPFI